MSFCYSQAIWFPLVHLKKYFGHVSFQKKLFAYGIIEKLNQTFSLFFRSCILWNKKISIFILHQIFSTSVIAFSIFPSAPFQVLQSCIGSASTTKSSLLWKSEKEKASVYISRVKSVDRHQLLIIFLKKK